MFNTFIKTLVRNSLRNKVFFLIKTLGLTIGITCFILIYLYVQYEKSYDTFHANRNNIFRIVMHSPGRNFLGSDISNVNPGPLAPYIKEKFPEVKYATRVKKCQKLVKYQQISDYESKILYVDPDFFKLFSFKLLSGNPDNALNDLYSIILTKKSAKKYFGNEDPLGKSLIIDENKEYTVTGIIDDVPDNSHLRFNFLISINTHFKEDGTTYSWGSSSYPTYFYLENTNTAELFEEKLNEAYYDVINFETNNRLLIQPLKDIQLHGNYSFEFEKNGNIKQVYIFFVIGIFLLLIACFNYVNLTSAHSFNRLKEVGIKKVIGAKKRQLFNQIVCESAVYVFMSTCIAIFLVKLCLPFLNTFLLKEITISYLLNYKVLSGIILSIFIVSIISGLLPAIVITKFNPVQIFKNKIQSSNNRFINLRSSFVVTQFIISIILIIGTLSVYLQLKYIQNKDLGFHKESIINLDLEDNDCISKYTTFKNELLKNPNIYDVTISNFLPHRIRSRTHITWKGNTANDRVYIARVGNNFLEFYGIKLKEGKGFSETGNSNNRYFVLNQTAVESFEMHNSIGKIVRISNVKAPITGIIQDIHYSPLHLKICPMAFLNMDENNPEGEDISIKINNHNMEKTISYIEKIFKQFSPDFPFIYSFLDESIEQAYTAEKKFKSLVQLFSIIAIIIACLGLFGLANYNLEKRVKEIGVRKVNGAKIREIILSLNTDFIKWIIIAFIIACPVASYAMNRWLEGFAYRYEISWWIYAIAGITVLIISLVTVSWQSWKAARRNPVEALRYE